MKCYSLNKGEGRGGSSPAFLVGMDNNKEKNELP